MRWPSQQRFCWWHRPCWLSQAAVAEAEAGHPAVVPRAAARLVADLGAQAAAPPPVQRAPARSTGAGSTGAGSTASPSSGMTSPAARVGPGGTSDGAVRGINDPRSLSNQPATSASPAQRLREPIRPAARRPRLEHRRHRAPAILQVQRLRRRASARSGGLPAPRFRRRTPVPAALRARRPPLPAFPIRPRLATLPPPAVIRPAFPAAARATARVPQARPWPSARPPGTRTRT